MMEDSIGRTVAPPSVGRGAKREHLQVEPIAQPVKIAAASRRVSR